MNNTISKSKGIIVILALVLLTLVSYEAASQTRIITGVVSDEAGPLPTATIIPEDQAKMTAANIEGFYSVEATIGEILKFNYAGYAEQSMVVGSSKKIDVKLLYLEPRRISCCSGSKSMQVRGIVTDTLRPLPSAKVRVTGYDGVKGHKKYIECDEYGKYDLTAYPGSTLVFSSKEYKPKRIQVAGSQVLDVTLVQKRTFFGSIFHSIGNLFR